MLKKLQYKCGKCGFNVNPTTKVCPMCGTRLVGLKKNPEVNDYFSAIGRSTPRLQDWIAAIIVMILAFFPIMWILSKFNDGSILNFANSLPYAPIIHLSIVLIIDIIIGIVVAYLCLENSKSRFR